MDFDAKLAADKVTLTLSPAQAAVLLGRAYQGLSALLDDQGQDTFMGGITAVQKASVAAHILKLRRAYPHLY